VDFLAIFAEPVQLDLALFVVAEVERLAEG